MVDYGKEVRHICLNESGGNCWRSLSWGPALVAELIAKKIPEAWLLKQEVVPAVLVAEESEGTQEACL